MVSRMKEPQNQQNCGWARASARHHEHKRRDAVCLKRKRKRKADALFLLGLRSRSRSSPRLAHLCSCADPGLFAVSVWFHDPHNFSPRFPHALVPEQLSSWHSTVILCLYPLSSVSLEEIRPSIATKSIVSHFQPNDTCSSRFAHPSCDTC